ncbi:2-oxoacid:ferredoxin oxidoreductase subunit beta [bacterium]|nr:2-oxoacid:ferredoxin oxidoreductase subunit beta [bacterium]
MSDKNPDSKPNNGRKPTLPPGMKPKGAKPPSASKLPPGMKPKGPPTAKPEGPQGPAGGDGASKATRADFSSDQDVRWCPGCGDYAILATVQRLMPELGVPREKVVFVSGIGCSSRFPYYMNTYGMHSIHGRAPTIVTGLKSARPDLDVWMITGDGDSLSIGGNHIIHIMRRNVNVQIIMFNNQIYGLTKGQYSPTSEIGKVTKSTPFGSLDHPFNPIALVLGAEASFAARTMDRDPKHMKEILKRAHDYRGTGFVEVYQNCNIFNDGAFFQFTEKETKSDRAIFFEHKKPLTYAGGTKGLRLNGFSLESIDLENGNFGIDDCLVYDETSRDLAGIMARVYWRPDLPQPFGVFYREDRPSYDDLLHKQVQSVIERSGKGSLEKLLSEGETWEVS